MEFLRKYKKYKKKYLSIRNRMKGGMETLDINNFSDKIIEFINEKNIKPLIFINIACGMRFQLNLFDEKKNELDEKWVCY